jgi:hypothetical protein
VSVDWDVWAVYEANEVAVQKVANRSIPVDDRLFPAWDDDPSVIASGVPCEARAQLDSYA